MAQLSGEEQELLRASVRSFLTARSDEATVRRLADSDTGFDPDAWRDLAALGVTAMLAPEAAGGLGLGYRELAPLIEEAAAFLYGGPLLSTAVLAPSALIAAGDAPADALIAQLASGSRLAAVAIDDAPAGGVTAEKAREGWKLSGGKGAVIDGATADLLLVVARDGAGIPGLFAVERAAAGLRVDPLEVFDRTRRQADLNLDGVAAQRLGGDFTDGLALLRDVGAVAAAAEQLGVSQRALDISVEYAKVRQQFGRPIGSFQAVKHLCAEMLTKVECQRAAVRAAAAALDGDPAERAETVSVAKAYGSEAATWVILSTIQVLGGIGFTWEHPAHLYLRRAKTLQHAFGDALHHRGRIATLAGFGAGAAA